MLPYAMAIVALVTKAALVTPPAAPRASRKRAITRRRSSMKPLPQGRAPLRLLFAHIEQEIAPIEVVVFNVGANVRFDIADTTERVYRKVWEAGALAGFLVGREAARVMEPRGRGSIFFTGATASLRGGAGFAAFAGAKHALRALSQSMARELGPKGIHVAHVVIDGAIDTPWIAANFPERYQLKDKDGILSPDAIADNYWMLHNQPRSAWTHELDLRPWMEPW
jgi:NAD(P)-dependent dehydrogenase (short-subunit alcohol dehydrogenase family)